jgi:hypothetical protein
LFAHHVQAFYNSSGSLAIFTAIRRASSLLSNLAAERRPGSLSVAQRLTVGVAHDETVRRNLGRSTAAESGEGELG